MDLEHIYASLVLRFKSGNDIPVTSARITAEEWAAIQPVLATELNRREYTEPTDDIGPTLGLPKEFLYND